MRVSRPKVCLRPSRSSRRSIRHRSAELESLFERVPVVITVEAHLPNGALRSFVAETIAEAGCACRRVSHAVERAASRHLRIARVSL